jgi:serine/threonine protein kinase
MYARVEVRIGVHVAGSVGILADRPWSNESRICHHDNFQVISLIDAWMPQTKIQDMTDVYVARPPWRMLLNGSNSNGHRDSVFCCSDIELSPPNIRSSYMVFELMDADLRRVLSMTPLSEEHIRFFIYQILCGLKVCKMALSVESTLLRFASTTL